MNDCLMTFQDISALRALGGDVKKNVHFQGGTISSHGRKHFSIYKHVYTCSALRAVGGDVEIFRTQFIVGDRDEKIDFRRITSGAT